MWLFLFCVEGNVTGEPEGMSEKDQRLASQEIDMFGLALVRFINIGLVFVLFLGLKGLIKTEPL